ncbi:MAG: outer membrane beta-barrel protein [Moheibacter sp.]
MKNSIYLILLTFAFQFTNAQSEFKIGGMLAYGTEIENLGFGVNAEIPVMEKLTISPSLIFYFPKDQYGVKINWFEVNANANYYFLDTDNIDLYGLAGINYSSVKVKYDGIDYGYGVLGGYSGSDGRIGANIGAGANFSIGSTIIPFAELKYVIIDGGQLVAAAGIKFSL